MADPWHNKFRIYAKKVWFASGASRCDQIRMMGINGRIGGKNGRRGHALIFLNF